MINRVFFIKSPFPNNRRMRTYMYTYTARGWQAAWTRDTRNGVCACCRVFEGEYTRGTRAGVIVIARPAVARVRFHRRCGAPLVRAHVRYTRVWEYIVACRCERSLGISPRSAQILLRAGINLLPAFRSRSQPCYAYGRELETRQKMGGKRESAGGR